PHSRPRRRRQQLQSQSSSLPDRHPLTWFRPDGPEALLSVRSNERLDGLCLTDEHEWRPVSPPPNDLADTFRSGLPVTQDRVLPSEVFSPNSIKSHNGSLPDS